MTVLLLLLALTGCAKEEPAKTSESPAQSTKTEAPKAAAPAPAAPAAALPEGANPALLDPSKAAETAPDLYKVQFETTKGNFVVEVHKDWAPQGADRFYNLVKIGFYDNIAFFRAIDGFMVQFGISGYPQVAAKWKTAQITDDPVKEKNTRGRITFATAGPNTRTTQVFINYVDGNTKLDGMGFAPFGEVISGMDIVDSLYKGYGEGAPRGKGPNQGELQVRGNTYLQEKFPELDYVKKATILP